MKLAIYFGVGDDIVPFIVDWDQALLDFPHIFFFDGKHWEWICHDVDSTGEVDHVLTYGSIGTHKLPYDMFGQLLPVIDFKQKFNIGSNAGNSSCECGAKHTGFPDAHMFYCPLWRKK